MGTELAALRLERLRAACAAQDIEAFFVRDLSNIRWLAAFDDVFDDEDAHALLVGPGSAVLHTDSRYAEAARQAATGTPLCVDDQRQTHAAFAVRSLEEGREAAAGADFAPGGEVDRDADVVSSVEAGGGFDPVSGAEADGDTDSAAGIIAVLGIEDTLMLGEYRTLETACAQVPVPPQLRETSGFVRALRAVKDSTEIASLKAAQAITDAAFSYIITFMRPGMTERAVQIELEDFMRRHGAEALAFPSIVATGANGASPHAIPGDTLLEAGQCVVLDFGARAQGYCSDMTRTVFLGQPDARMCAAYETIRRANECVQAALKPGITGAAMHEVAERVLAEGGFAGKMGHSLGHGVGIDIHEEPNLSPRNQQLLVVGNVVTVEPGIYLPGEFGMRLEDFGVLTHEGFAVFTESTHDMVII